MSAKQGVFRKKLEVMLPAILAGVAIGIGGAVNLSLCPENKVAGAVFFSIGLFIILTMQMNLFTGKICYALENKFCYLLDVLIIWIGNFIGTFAVAGMIHLTRLSARMTEVAAGMVETKLSDGLLSLFILGIFCNILIYVAVDGYKNNKHVMGKYFGIIFSVAVFILAGFEHSVADMFYISVANAWSLRALLAIIVISLGNVVGGLLIPVARKVCEKLK